MKIVYRLYDVIIFGNIDFSICIEYIKNILRGYLKIEYIK